MGRLMDPNEFAVLQVASYARFNRVETDLLTISALLTGLAMLQAWRLRHRLDVLALGRTAAVNLGETPDRGRLEVLVLIAILVAVSTALVGPVTFLGLLVVNIAYVVLPTHRHAVLLPGAALISAITLVGGQTVLERALGLVTPLSVIVDLVGGAVFLWLILKGVKR
jgi:iron complex transport system permease protein